MKKTTKLGSNILFGYRRGCFMIYWLIYFINLVVAVFDGHKESGKVEKRVLLKPQFGVGRYIADISTDNYKYNKDMLEITCNDRLGKKVRVKCNPDDTIGDLKKLIAAQTGTHWEKIVLKKWYTIFKDHIKLQDYEIHDGMNLELYYQ